MSINFIYEYYYLKYVNYCVSLLQCSGYPQQHHRIVTTEKYGKRTILNHREYFVMLQIQRVVHNSLNFGQENNLHWENENKQNFLMSEVEDDRDDNGLDDDDNADDRSSISSENSCCDVLTPESSPLRQKVHIGQSTEAKIWHSMPDIDKTILKELPNAESILDDLIAEKWESTSPLILLNLLF